jgi:tetratricopeptide (TPR) repeat protein
VTRTTLIASDTTLQAKGNAAFSAGNYTDAVSFFSQAIELDPSNHVLFSNRSASHASLKDYEAALDDAKKCVSLKPGMHSVLHARGGNDSLGFSCTHSLT